MSGRCAQWKTQYHLRNEWRRHLAARERGPVDGRKEIRLHHLMRAAETEALVRSSLKKLLDDLLCVKRHVARQLERFADDVFLHFFAIRPLERRIARQHFKN